MSLALGRRATLGAALAFPALGAAWAQQRFDSLFVFVPAAPGGGWDLTGRAIEQAARTAGLVGSFQFENVGGGGGMVGLPRFVNQRRGQANALIVGGSIMLGTGITGKSSVTVRDVPAIARLTSEAGVIVVPAASPYRDFAGLAAALKANPGAVPIGGSVAGGIDHVMLGLILKALGRSPRDASYVGFQAGGQNIAAVLGGQVQASISGYSEFSEQIKAGRLRALAISGETRLEGEGSDIPTLREQGVDVTLANWRGVFGAPGTTAAQQQALASLMGAIHATPQWKEILRTRAWADAFLAGEAFARFVEKDIADTEAVLKDLGLA
ncbi:Bug family tripartite tricarboxylate transporter substrate binding protein [Elioraea rosea]|uniref:Bug family tripartite tricarboxylate transporter substrate binding protein n=1 Tax=Elioraea rosea TaxID=2492390 RepID=UPI00118416CB|nr:tripartite tricarboxylate transporter substrate-binding protein [Elioraea rosea]